MKAVEWMVFDGSTKRTGLRITGMGGTALALLSLSQTPVMGRDGW